MSIQRCSTAIIFSTFLLWASACGSVDAGDVAAQANGDTASAAQPAGGDAVASGIVTLSNGVTLQLAEIRECQTQANAPQPTFIDQFFIVSASTADGEYTFNANHSNTLEAPDNFAPQVRIRGLRDENGSNPQVHYENLGLFDLAMEVSVDGNRITGEAELGRQNQDVWGDRVTATFEINCG